MILARRVGLALSVLIAVLLVAGYRSDRDPAELEARYAVAPSKFVDVDGARVHYRDQGTGPAVLLVHGSNSSLFTWEGWASALAPSHRVVTLDMPGHGLTGPDPRDRYSAAAMAEFLDSFAKAVGLSRFTVAGNSMGGNVAWHYALAHPEHVDRLILVDAAGIPSHEPRPIGLRISAAPVLGAVARWDTPRFAIAGSIRDAYGDPSRVTGALVDRYEDLMLRRGNRAATRQRFAQAAMRYDGMDSRLGEIHVPTLILWGSRDHWILPKYAEVFRARIPGARLVMLDGLGHVPMEEDPAASVAPVKEFLGGQ